MLALAAHLKPQHSPKCSSSAHSMHELPRGNLSVPKTWNTHQNPAVKPQTRFYSDHHHWPVGFVDWRTLRTQTGFVDTHTAIYQSGWPKTTTPALRSDLDEEALPHFTEQLFAMTSPTGLITTLWRTFNCSEVLPTANLHQHIHYLLLHQLSLIGKTHFCSTVFICYWAQPKSHVHRISGFGPNWQVSTNLWWFVDFRVFILPTQKRCIS